MPYYTVNQLPAISPSHYSLPAPITGAFPRTRTNPSPSLQSNPRLRNSVAGSSGAYPGNPSPIAHSLREREPSSLQLLRPGQFSHGHHSSHTSKYGKAGDTISSWTWPPGPTDGLPPSRSFDPCGNPSSHTHTDHLPLKCQVTVVSRMVRSLLERQVTVMRDGTNGQHEGPSSLTSLLERSFHECQVSANLALTDCFPQKCQVSVTTTPMWSTPDMVV